MLRRRRDLGQYRAEIRHGRGDAAGAVRNPGAVQSHLDSRQRAAQHQIVEVPEMADAKHLGPNFAEAGAERHVEGFEDDFAQAIGELECSRGSTHSTSRPHPATARLVASAWRAWRWNTAGSPSSSSSIFNASRSPNNRFVAGV